jgi:hypothetical protein
VALSELSDLAFAFARAGELVFDPRVIGWTPRFRLSTRFSFELILDWLLSGREFVLASQELGFDDTRGREMLHACFCGALACFHPGWRSIGSIM